MATCLSRQTNNSFIDSCLKPLNNGHLHFLLSPIKVAIAEARLNCSLKYRYRVVI